MTIHSDHPFPTPDDPARRFRGHLPAPVTIWAAGEGSERHGLTVTSVLVAAGDPPHVLGLVDEESALWTSNPTVFTVNALAVGQGALADAFAGVAPAPGGPFTVGQWSDSAWGPVLEGGAGWIGAHIVDEPRRVGFGLLVDAVIDHVEPGDAEVLLHVRGRYR